MMVNHFMLSSRSLYTILMMMMIHISVFNRIDNHGKRHFFFLKNQMHLYKRLFIFSLYNFTWNAENWIEVFGLDTFELLLL